MKIRLLFVFVLMGWGIGTMAQEKDSTAGGIVFMENQPWETVLQKAKEQNRLIFMDCYTVWCGPCKGLSQNVFPQKEVGDFFNANFVNAKYDMEKGDGKMLYEKYKAHIIGFPTLLLIDQDGNVVHQMAGYQEPDALIAGMKAGLEGKTLAAMEKKYEAGARDFETIRDYVAALRGAFKQEEIQKVMADYLPRIPVDSLLNKEIWDLVGTYVTDPYTDAYEFVLDHLDKYQYRLKVDRYQLESQLGRAMDDAVDEIIKVTTSTTNADTLSMMAEKEKVLRAMLERSIVRNFSTYFCKLEINDRRLANDVDDMYQLFVFADRLNLLPYEGNFRRDAYLYIVEHSKDEKILNELLEKLLIVQAEEDKGENLLLKENYYHVISALYSRLGQEDKAAEAQKNYGQLEKAQEDKIKSWFMEEE